MKERSLFKQIKRKVSNEFGKPSSITFNKRKKYKKLNIDIDIVAHCNLNCRGCNHFSPLAEEEYISIEEFKNEINKLSELLYERIDSISLMGGEPLLHKKIVCILDETRKSFPTQKISIVTNGLLLGKMDSDFWEMCRKTGIEIEVTKYPIKFDYSIIKKRARQEHVVFHFFGRSKYVQKTLYYMPLDKKGEQDMSHSYYNCFLGGGNGQCINLRNGKLYICPYIAFIDRFNKYFGQNFEVTEDDYIDIFAYGQNQETIMKVLREPVPFCKFCDVNARTYGEKWRTSKREIVEWCNNAI